MVTIQPTGEMLHNLLKNIVAKKKNFFSSLTASVDLCLCVSGNRFQKRTISVLICVIWLYSLLWAVFPLLGWGGYGPEPYGLACSVDWAGYQRSLNGASFIMALTILCTLIPCGFILFSYSGIAWKLHKAYQSIQIHESLPNTGTVERKVTLVRFCIHVMPKMT